MKPVAVATVLLTCGLVAGCGDQPGTGPGASPPGEWTSEHLKGAPSVDSPTVLATDADDALVLMISDDGVLRSHVSVDGGGFDEGEPLATGEQYVALAGAARLRDGGWYAVGSGGTVRENGDDELVFEPIAFFSDDGLAWEQVEVTGFADAVDLHDLDVVDGRIVAVGSYRTEREMGGFEARAWTSVDGRSFEEVRLPGVPDYQGYDDESYAGSLATVEGALLASGRIGDAAALWRSDDGGVTWSRVEAPLLRDAYAVSGLEVVDSTVVATISADRVQAIRSADGGRTWEPVDALPVNEEADGWAPLWSGGGRFFTLTGVEDQSWSRPEVCYADLGQCDSDRQPEPRVVASADGGTWSAVDVPGDEEVSSIGGTTDGRVLAMVVERGGVAVHTWPAGADLPVADDPLEPETVELVTVPEGEEPEVGVRYHAPMYVHCGMEWFWFGNATWRRTDDGPDVETGAGESAPDGWPLVGQVLYGYATVDADGTLEYSTEDGTVIATYERRSGAPGCA